MTDLAPSAPGSSDDFRTRLENDIYKQRAAQEATEKLQLGVEFAVHKQQSKQQIEHLEQRVEQLEQQLAAARKESTQKIEQLEQQLAASIAAGKDSTQRIEQLEQQLAASTQETDKERAAKIAAETALAAALASGSKSQQGESGETGLKTPPPSNGRTPPARSNRQGRAPKSIHQREQSSEGENSEDDHRVAVTGTPQRRARRKRVASSDSDPDYQPSRQHAAKRLKVPEVVVPRLTTEARRKYTPVSSSGSSRKRRARAEGEDEAESSLTELSEVEPSAPAHAVPATSKQRPDAMDVDSPPAKPSSGPKPPSASASDASDDTQRVARYLRSPSRELSYVDFGPQKTPQRVPAEAPAVAPQPSVTQPERSTAAPQRSEPVATASNVPPRPGADSSSTQQPPHVVQLAPQGSASSSTAVPNRGIPNLLHTQQPPSNPVPPSQTPFPSSQGHPEVAPQSQTQATIPPTPGPSTQASASSSGTPANGGQSSSTQGPQASPSTPSRRRRRHENIVVAGVHTRLPPPMMEEDKLHERMEGCTPWEGHVQPRLTEVIADRRAFNSVVGGSTAFVVVNGREGDRLLFPTLAMYPHLPLVLGAPGLFVTPSPQPEWKKGLQKLVVGLRPQCWWYVGDYEVTPAAPFTMEEFKDWLPNLKEQWAERIATANYRDIQARIFLRRACGREPTDAELAVARKEKWRDTDIEHIIEAYENGEEKLYAWRLQCKEFDHEFAGEIKAEADRQRDKKPNIEALDKESAPVPQSSSMATPTQVPPQNSQS